MKMPKPAFEELRQLLSSIPAILDPNLSPKRRLWDSFWSIPYTARQSWFDRHRIYETMDDSHIETALRRILN